MRFKLNWIQRSLLIFAGLFMGLMAAGSLDPAFPETPDKGLATFQFLAAFILFVIAASPRKEGGNGE